MSNIDSFLNKFVDSIILNQGHQLYADKKVLSVDYSSVDDTWMCVVEGSRKYITKIRGLATNRIKCSCTCDYNWGPVCKHGVAALFAIDNHEESDEHAVKKRKISIKKRVAGKYPIKDYKFITRDFVLNNTLPEFHSLLYVVANYYIKHAFIHEDSISVELAQGSKTVRIRNINGKISIQSDEHAQHSGLYQAEAAVLMVIAESNYPDIFERVFDNINKFKTQKLKEYGLGARSNFHNFFSLSIDFTTGIKAEPNNLIRSVIVPSNNETNGQKMLDSLLSEINQNRSLPVSELMIHTSYLMGFVLIRANNISKNYFLIEPIEAKSNKQKTKLSSHFTALEKGNTAKSKPTSNQQQIVKLAANNKDLETSLELWTNFYHSLIALSDEPFIFIKDEMFTKLSKNTLKPILISKVMANVEVDISKDSMFYIATMKVRIGSDLYDFDQIDFETSNGSFVVLENEEILHPVQTYESGVVLEQGNEDIKMSKKFKEEFFDQVISPLSKKFVVNFQKGTYNVEVLALDYTKKQIYLSEEDNYLMIRPMVVYDGEITVDIFSKGNVMHNTDEEVREYVRNFDLEQDFINFINGLHPSFNTQRTDDSMYLHYEDFMKDMWFYNFFEKLQQSEIEVFGLKDLKNFKYSIHHANISTTVKSGIDWFEVDLKVSFGDNVVNIKDLKKAILNKQKFVKLSDGSVGILPTEWFEKLNKYFRQGEVSGNKIEISKLKFSIIDELFDTIDDNKIIEELAEKRSRIANFNEIKKVSVSKNIKGELRDYQKEGLNWLNFLDEMSWGGILADDMGLGKTLQILAFMQRVQKKDTPPSLIVIPTTLLFNWESELAKFAPKLKAHYHYGPFRDRSVKGFKENDVVFTTYGVLLRDIAFLKEFRFNYLILDESQAIKNPHSRRFKAAMLINSKNRVALTGTPIENSTFDLFAQMNFANPGFFGNIRNFQEGYSIPIDKDGNTARANELQRLIDPFVLRRTKEKVATELPAKTEDIIYCEMETDQRQVYDAYRNRYKNELLGNIEAEGLGSSKLMVLKALTRLRQICDSPALIKDENISTNESIKIKEISKHITTKTANHKVLVFSQFVGMLSLIKDELRKHGIDYEYLDGKCSTKQRENSVNNFQNNSDLRVFLISLKAGGTGLNLTAADYVYIMDPWWNPAVENQAIDRCYRIGQAKKVFAYRMICKDTVEEKIMKLQAKKKKLAKDIIHVDENIMKTIDVNDIKDLFSR